MELHQREKIPNMNVIEVNDNIRNVVRETLEQLVSHFGEEFLGEVLEKFSKDATKIPVLLSATICTKHEQVQQHERSTQPILRFWLNRLLSTAYQIHDPGTVVEASNANAYAKARCRDNERTNEGCMNVLCEWVRGYEGTIRPHVFSTTDASCISDSIPTFDIRCIPILRNYELVLSKMLFKFEATKKENSTSTITMSSLSYSKGREYCLRVINLLSTDISLSTVGTKEDYQADCNKIKNDEKNNIRRNEGLPILLRILGCTLETLRQIITTLCATNDNDRSNEQFKLFMAECYGCLRQCAMTLLAFDVLNENEHKCSSTDSVQSSSAVFLPYNLSPSLLTCGDYRKKDLALVRRMLEHLEKSRSSSFSKNSSGDVRRYFDEVLGADSLSYDCADYDYWHSLLSSSPYSLSTVAWIDPNLENAEATRGIVHDIWCSIESLLTFSSKQVNYESRKDEGDSMKIKLGILTQYRERRDFVLKMLGGPGILLRDVRTHFFRRNLHGIEDRTQRDAQFDNYDSDDIEISSAFVQMGRRVTTSKKSTNCDTSLIDGPIYERIPSRTAAAANALRLLLLPALINDNDKECRENMLEDVFPICAALLDSNIAGFRALGAAGFLRAIDMLAPREIDPFPIDLVPGQCVSQEMKSIVDVDVWTNFVENTLTVLDRALQSSSDAGHVVVAIGRVQSRIFEIMLSRRKLGNDEGRNLDEYSNNHFRRRRRIVTEQWLLNLETSLYRPTTESQHLELLVGGVIPLLSQHAIDEGFGTEGMEVGRLGLAALLPLTTIFTTAVDMSDQFGEINIVKKTQIASMVALINLIFAAHPIVTVHGGKIMSHLLMIAAYTTSYISVRENKDGGIGENPPTMGAIRNMAILFAAIVLVAFESEFAIKHIESIENERGQYHPDLLSIVSEVREIAAGLEMLWGETSISTVNLK